MPADKLLNILNSDLALSGSSEFSQYSSFGNMSGDKQGPKKNIIGLGFNKNAMKGHCIGKGSLQFK